MIIRFSRIINNGYKRKPLPDVQECSRCGEKPNKYCLTLHNWGKLYLCDKCYVLQVEIEGLIITERPKDLNKILNTVK